MTRPRIQLAGKDTESPLPIVNPSNGTDVVVVAGEVREREMKVKPWQHSTSDNHDLLQMMHDLLIDRLQYVDPTPPL